MADHPAAARIIGLYQRHAAQWDRKRSRTLMERQWLRRFADLLPSAGSVLDIGCGSGEPIAAHLVAQGLAVTGVDTSEDLIALCRGRLPAATWHVADMRVLALGKRFDGLIAWDSFFHLTPADQRAMFPVFRAHAAPGAGLLFTSGLAAGEAIGVFEGEPLYHASLDASEYRELLDAEGFEEVAQVCEDPDCGRHTIWLARARS